MALRENPTPIHEKLAHQLSIITQSMPPEVTDAIEAVETVDTRRMTAELGNTFRSLVNFDLNRDPEGIEKRTAQLAVLEKIMEGDLTRTENPEIEATALRMCCLAVSAITAHPILKGIENSSLKWDWSHMETPEDGRIQTTCLELAKHLAPHLAILVADAGGEHLERKIKFGQKVAAKAQIERHISHCLDDNSDPLTLKDALAEAHENDQSRQALVEFSLPLFVGIYLEELIRDYLALVIGARLEAKGQLADREAQTRIHHALTATIIGQFPKRN